MAGVGRPLKTGTRGRKNGKQALRNTKVDVVADAGRRWVRVLTTKPATLLAEFREAESYRKSFLPTLPLRPLLSLLLAFGFSTYSHR